MEVKLLKVAGLDVILPYVGIPMKHKHDSPEDAMETLSRLVKAGDEHAKLCRMVMTWWEINAPRYWWSECDTYSIGSCGYSESTVHTIMKHEITVDDFEGLVDEFHFVRDYLDIINDLIEAGEFFVVKSLLPESYLQKRLKMFSYQTLRRMYFQRRNHKLPQWHQFLDKVKELPYAEELILRE